MNMFVTSDHHFHHGNVLTFLDRFGSRIRPEFDNVKDMNDFMITQWNTVVKPRDRIYHLGDILMQTSAWAFEEILPNLNGIKSIVLGNHDKARTNIYMRYFKDIRGVFHKKTGDGDMVLMSHYPLHTSSVWKGFNVHGHLHQNELDDLRYINVSVELHNYTPLEWGEVQTIIRERKTMMENKEKENV